MGFASLGPFSLFLLLLCAAAHVEPPTNVTLHCQSMKNVLKWDYNQNTPGLKFRVDIGAYYRINADGFRNVTWAEPPAHEADLSFLSDPSEAYYLTVTAVVGDQESDPSPSEDGITFSYYRDAEVNQKCFVDFPSVNITAHSDNNLLLSFQHPWLTLYEKVLSDRQRNTRKKKSHDADLSNELPVFDYKVAIVNQKRDHHSYSCEEAVCEERLPVDPNQEKHCLTLSGDLEQMVVKGDQVYCAPSFKLAPARDHTYMYLIGLGLLTALSALIFSMIYCKKTKPSSEIPHCLISSNPTTPDTVAPDTPNVGVVDDVSPRPLQEESDVEACLGFTHSSTSSSDYASRMRLRLQSEDEGVSDIEEGQRREAPYMHGGSLDEDDVSSGYEKRGVPVQLEPGDTAQGYRG